MAELDVPVDAITDWDTFHTVMAEALGFEAYYGRNSGAFQDSLWSIAHTADGAPPRTLGESVTLNLGNVDAFRARCPDQFRFLVDSAAWVNAGVIADEYDGRHFGRIVLAYESDSQAW